MFAKRTDWDLGPNKITKILQELRHSGKTILDLTESNPSCCGFLYPEKEILDALSHRSNMLYDPSAKGTLHARKAICSYYADKGMDVNPEMVFLTANTSEAYSFLFKLLVNPSERVLFPRPSYPLFEFLAGLNDVRPDFYPLVYSSGEWRINYQAFCGAATRKTRAVVLVNPNNPTGSFLNGDELNTINSVCGKQEIPLICDEVFIDYVFDKEGIYSSLVNNWENLTFVLGGLSKSLGLPQMKLSWIVVSGPGVIVERAAARLEMIADTYLSVNTPSQTALSEWMGFRAVIQGEILNRIRHNRALISEILLTDKDNSCSLLNAQGGWYAILSLPENVCEEAFVIGLLQDSSVFVYPGYFFDFNSGNHIVLSLLTKAEVFEKGLCVIRERLRHGMPPL